MEHYKNGAPKDFFDIEKRLGRMMRNMSLIRMSPLGKNGWFPAADIYESDQELVAYIDVSGSDPQSLSVIAEENALTVSGERNIAIESNVKSIHQLEIERGIFKRTLTLPSPIDVSATTSTCKNGFLIVRLPKQVKKGKIEIAVY